MSAADNLQNIEVTVVILHYFDLKFRFYLAQGNKIYDKLNKGKCSGNIRIEILNKMLKKMCFDLQ